MTTTVTVHVGGKYRAFVTQDNQLPVVIEGDGERTFTLAHPASSVFVVTEEAVADGGEQPAA